MMVSTFLAFANNGWRAKFSLSDPPSSSFKNAWPESGNVPFSTPKKGFGILARSSSTLGGWLKVAWSAAINGPAMELARAVA